MGDVIEAAYAPLVASLRAGSFRAPDEGWPAELIGAHVAMNNDLIADLAERVAGGEHPSYDNSAAVDEAQLEAFAKSVGGLVGLADAVERSAVRLAAARAALDEEQAATLVPVVIHDGGEVVADRPIPIGAFCQGNASFHLDSHREQLRGLEVLLTRDPPAEFDRYELVLLLRAAGDPGRSDEELAVLQSQHLGHFAKLRAAGYLRASGPLDGEEGETLAGISIYQTGSREKARLLAEDDPSVRAGRLEVKVLDWYTSKGAVSFDG